MRHEMTMLAAAAAAAMMLGWTQAHPDGDPDVDLHWCSSSFGVQLNEQGSADIADESDLEAVRISMDVWNSLDCTRPAIVDKGLTGNRDIGGAEDPGPNIVVWLSGAEWMENGYDPNALALTTLWFAPETGRIFGADLELNDAHRWSARGQGVLTDVWNTVVHEMGHMLGMDHSLDKEATMYPTATTGETKKRDLAEDDIEGICTMYGHSYSDCEESCGCGSDSNPGPYGLLPMAALGALAALRSLYGRWYRGV